MENGTVQNQPMVDAAQSEMPKAYAQAPEGFVTQDKANYLVSQAKQAAYEQGMREAQSRQQSAPQAQPAIDINDIVAKAKDMAKAELHQELKANQDDMYIRNLMSAHNQTLDLGIQEYGQDFKESAGNINFDNYPQLVPLINSMPNAKEVILELGKEANEDRYEKITNKIFKRDFSGAEKAMRKFADSIASNKGAIDKAKGQPNIPEPLSSIKPSTASAGSSQPQTYAEISAHIEKMLAGKR